MLYHLTARAHSPQQPFSHASVARWTWLKLQKAWPNALAACLMPNHLHLLVELPDSQPAVESLQRILAAQVGLFYPNRPNGIRIWQPIPEPSLVIGQQKLWRNIKYIALNPCRSGLVDDPLSWRWSTHLDLMGGRAKAWITPHRLAEALSLHSETPRQSLHRYISSDPSCDPDGSIVPKPAPRRILAQFSLNQIAQAAATAHLGGVESITQRGTIRTEFLRLAWHQGWQNRKQLRIVTQTDPRTIRRTATKAPSRAARLCLNDPRIRGVR